MGLVRISTVALVLLRAVAAQAPEDALKSKITGVHYPALGESARIQGDVRLNVKSGAVSLLSGHPMLVQIAVENAKALGSILGETNFEVTYHFVLDTPFNSVRTSRTVKRGNAFERAVLRMFGLKTEKVTVVYDCKEVAPPPSDLKISGAVIEIWVHGREFCLQTEAAAVVAKR